MHHFCQAVLLHVGYSTCLIFAYRYGDLSHVYPLARGSAPLIVAMASVMLFSAPDADWKHMRNVWEYSHVARAGLHILGFLSMTMALIR